MIDENTMLTAINACGNDKLDLPFWRGTTRGEFLLHRCELCGRSYWPASLCVEHGGTDMRWVPASGRGEVHVFTVLRHGFTPEMKARVPYNVSVIKLDEGPFFHSNVIDCPDEALKPGLRVKVKFSDDKPALRLPLFVPE